MEKVSMLKRIYAILILICLGLLPFLSAGQKIKAVKITAIEKILKETKQPVIINFWATWCGPCVEELPYFIAEAEQQKDNLQFILVSLDFKESFPGKVEKFAKKKGMRETVFWLDETDADYFCPKIDSSWSGAIPASLFYNPATGYRQFYEEKISQQALQTTIKSLLK